MSSAGIRERKLPVSVYVPGFTIKPGGDSGGKHVALAEGKQKTVSESHRMNRKTGAYNEGGPFYTSRISYVPTYGSVSEAYSFSLGKYYSGPILCNLPSLAEREAVGFNNPLTAYGSVDESKLNRAGATAIAQSAPTNPASDLGVGLAEVMHEGLPSLPGVQSWKRRTEKLKALGSEYLNYQFGWAPLHKEVTDVVNATRHHKLLLEQHKRGEGKNTHRVFSFPSSVTTKTQDFGSVAPFDLIGPGSSFVSADSMSRRSVSLVRETRCWFEGCFTYALPSSSDSWKKALGFGSQADQLYGLALNPEILWELTPWSWAVDWFSNTQDVIHNVTQFGLAGLVMRYGYIMEETIETVTAHSTPQSYLRRDYSSGNVSVGMSGSSSFSIEAVTKVRRGANPFGFGVAWEGLSPTQLAITAALGITKLR